MDRLLNFCRQHGLSFALDYGESDNSFELTVYGAQAIPASDTENFRARGFDFESVVDRVIADAGKHYAELKARK